MPPTPEERMVAAAAARLTDDDVAFVGIGVPSLAAVLAKRTGAPGITLMYESGVIDAVPPHPPLSTGSPGVIADTAYAGGCLAVFGELQAGRVTVGLLSAAQMDRRGNLNSTVIGSYDDPKIRLVGSGGAHDIASLAGRIMILMPHDPRRFVEHVDFITSPGHPPEGAASGPGGGPSVVVTPRAIFEFDDGEMTLTGLMEGMSAADATEGFPWHPPQRAELDSIPLPSAGIVEVLRSRVNPERNP